MAKRRNGLSWLLGIFGFLLWPMWMDLGGYSFLGLIGTILLIISLSLYAKAKGRNPAWGLFGILGWFCVIGAIIIFCLKDYSSNINEQKHSI